LTSVVIQGTSLAKVARWLHLTLPVNLKQRNKSDIEFTESPKSLLTEVIVKEGCPAAGKKIVQLGWPTTIVISTIERDGKYFIPTGATKLEKGDRLFLLAENRDSLNYVFDCVNIKQQL
jgi:cell volume regulation protein A